MITFWVIKPSDLEKPCDYFKGWLLCGWVSSGHRWKISNQRLKCYEIEMNSFLEKLMSNSYPLPYINRTCLMWEFLASELPLKRVQMSHNSWCTYLYLRHVVLSFLIQSSSYTIFFSFTHDNNTPKWFAHPSHFFHISRTYTHPFTLHFKFVTYSLQKPKTPPCPYFM